MGPFLTYFANRKDAFTSIVTILLLIVGLYNYFEYKRDKRITFALDLLERRESSLFVESRAKTIQKWIDNEQLRDAFASTKTYTEDLMKSITEQINSDSSYRSALFNMSTFYSNAAACTVDGICDAPIMCGSLMGEVQDYLDVNKWYIAAATLSRQEDAKALTLHMPEFQQFCETKLLVRVASRFDRSFGCQFDVATERLLGFHVGDNCAFSKTRYDEEIDVLVERMKPKK